MPLGEKPFLKASTDPMLTQGVHSGLGRQPEGWKGRTVQPKVPTLTPSIAP